MARGCQDGFWGLLNMVLTTSVSHGSGSDQVILQPSWTPLLISYGKPRVKNLCGGWGEVRYMSFKEQKVWHRKKWALFPVGASNSHRITAWLVQLYWIIILLWEWCIVSCPLPEGHSKWLKHKQLIFNQTLWNQLLTISEKNPDLFPKCRKSKDWICFISLLLFISKNED